MKATNPVLIGLALALMGAASSAVGATAAPKAFVGAWWLGPDGEGAQACKVRLNAAPVIGGFQLRADKACAKVTPRADDLYAWYVSTTGDVVMADPIRQPVLILKPLKDKQTWVTAGADDERLLLRKVTR